ncbi:MAG: hypothetical protein ACFCD0_07145 [Gemmataceae bacterium]
MSRKRVKNYWVKKVERFTTHKAAQDRAGAIRTHEHAGHVQVQPSADGFQVSYSVARWYVEELERVGVRL